ncbi:putative membrane fusion protein [Candidatus Terasakiella magnetica]|uniref:Putative membrane fusion protein n=1 Tax=Candidatus Terasakiella magnetica TaxID=1867952 RepID=A0A1C3RK65_9PROT|nr:efflux RND transporter periplasmic adaptor subunit [Candidatus Terasakiella magnetica]SCA57700.1 putative membrane fusion protein [Candidatus Terasakiella magnetica]
MNLRSFALLSASIFFQSSLLWAQDSFLVKQQEIEDQKAVLATVQTVDLTPARARIGGTVVELLVDEGSLVKAGEVIARIKDEKLQLEKQAVDARMASLQAERKLAQIALTRAQRLRKSGAGSQARLDEARTNLDVVLKNLKAMDNERELVLQREREGAVLSPANGRVLSVKVTSGVVVMPGEAIASIAEETYILRIEVPERHARFIKVGDQVQVGERSMSTDNGGKLRAGTVRQVYPEMQNGRVVADVEVSGLGDFFIGERIRVFVSTGTRTTFLLPKEYVYSRYGLHYVRLKDKTEIVVQPGRLMNDHYEILSGLREGDELIGAGS